MNAILYYIILKEKTLSSTGEMAFLKDKSSKFLSKDRKIPMDKHFESHVLK